MPTVNFNGVTVDVPDAVLSNPQALKDVARSVAFTQNRDETTGADAATRFAVGSAPKPEDQLATLQARGYDAARIGEDLYYRDEAGKSRRVNPKGLDIGDLAGAAPEIAETAGSVLGGILGGGAGLATGPGAVATAMAGSAMGAVAGREGAQALGRQFFGTEDRRTGLERFADVGTTAALGAVGEGVARAAGSVVKGLRTPFSPDDYTHVTNRIAQGAGIDQTAAQATPSMATRLAEQYGLQSPIGRPAMQEALSAQQRALQDSLQKVGGVGFNQSRLAGKPVLDEAADPETWAFPTVKDVMRSRAASPDMRDVGRSLRKFGRQGEDVKKTFVQQKLNDLGIGSPQFNAQNFLQQFDALPDTDRAMLGLSGELGKELNALIRVAKNVGKQQTRTGKPLATPVGGLMNALGIGASFTAGGLPGAIGGVMAPYLTARLMTWTPFVKALSRPVSNPGQWTRRLTRLAAQAEKDGPREDLGRFMEALGAQ